MHAIKYTTRSLDELGRIVLPIELRRKFTISDAPLTFDIYHDEEKNIIQLVPSGSPCIICGADNSEYTVGKRFICKSCYENINIER